MAENPSFSTLTTKQKVIGILTLVIIAFIIYEVIGLFSSGGSKPATTISAPPAQSKQMTGATPAQGSTQASTSTASNILPTVNAISLPKEALDVKQDQQQQQSYLDSVNQLQLLKVKRDIAETNQAIAAARLATETANKNMSDLLTQPALPQVPVSVYSSKLAEQMPMVETTTSTATSTIKAPAVIEPQFVVISVSMEFNRWSAILGSGGKMYSVSIGDTLFDGSTVASINKSGVVLTKDGKRKKVNIQTTI